MEQGIINFAVYEDGVEYMGLASADLPDATFLTQTISGAGIGGNVEAVFAGMMDSMTLGLHFRATTDQSIKLSEPRRHTIDLRVAQQKEDPVSATISTQGVKHVFVIVPKSDKGGSIAPASLGTGSGEYSVRYWATYIDGVKKRELDPLNLICEVNGVDYLSAARKALGK